MNSSPLKFHRDEQGVARAVYSGDGAEGNLLAQFFEADLGADVAYCDRLRAEAEKHHQGRGTAWKTSGNSFAVSIDGAKVSLHPLFGANQNRAYSLATPEFLHLLNQWRELIG